MNISDIHPRSPKFVVNRLQGLVQGRLWLKVLIGMATGIIAGLILGPTSGFVPPATAHLIGNWLALPGQLFLAMLQMIVVPLVFASIIRGIASTEDLEQLRKIGFRALLFFVATTIFASGVGIGITMLIKPGLYLDAELVRTSLGSGEATLGSIGPATLPGAAEIPEKLIGLLPQNPLMSLVEHQMLQVVLFAIVVGMALVTMKPKSAKPILELLGSVQELCISIVRWSMVLAPVAVMGLMAQLTTKIGLQALLGMSVYVMTVLLGLLLVLMMYLLIVGLVTRRWPIGFVANCRDVMLLAFSTSSSAAVMPLSIKTADEKLGIRPSISQFVIPLGTTVNMAGTALYQSVATLFLAQLFQVELNLGAKILIIMIAVASSVGAPATPGVGIVILATLLKSVGVPLSGIALVMGVDRLLDMARTTINVTGDLVACVVMDKWVGGAKSPEEELDEQRKREIQRAETGEDVVIEKPPNRRSS